MSHSLRLTSTSSTVSWDLSSTCGVRVTVRSEDSGQGAAAHVFVDPVLVDGPDGGHVGLHELGQRHGLEVGAGTHQPGLAHPAVPYQHHLDRER